MNALRCGFLLLAVWLLGGCAAWEHYELNDQYGKPAVRDRIVHGRVAGPEFYHDIKPILDGRCVVCHGCYDAPCQLKLSSYAGLDRGANKDKVYDGTRLLASSLSRLFIDARSTEEWRSKDFYPVLNERKQVPDANRQGSVLLNMLQLKQAHPLPASPVLPDSFDFSLDRNQQCPKLEEFPRFAEKYPLWGMPYGLPGLTRREFNTLALWVRNGSPVAEPDPLPATYTAAVARWEAFLNQDSLKARLASRYIYEHLFYGNLYFSELPAGEYFHLVRSSTPPGQPIAVIATRRPYDDPGVARVYYRLQHDESTVLAKSHLPYALNGTRLERWQHWFIDAAYTVTALPGYTPDIASNPFVAFRDLPANSRYRFMLDEAQFIIEGFIKGPVCRGQIALNVIDDQFWVFFASPDDPAAMEDTEFLARESQYLRLPAEEESNALPVASWMRYAKLEKAWLHAKGEYAQGKYPGTIRPTLSSIWDGDGQNPNAALTVFRHFDSASVVRGLVGDTPKTAWVIGYPLLERIHYLLVAGFDVYGNVGHQFITRLYMDFLRMEGETHFLWLLPESARARERAFWYRDASRDVMDYFDNGWMPTPIEPAIAYTTDNPKQELYALLKQHLAPVLDHSADIGSAPVSAPARVWLQRLAGVQGTALSLMPETALLTVSTARGEQVFTLIHNDAHKNLTSLFDEDKRRVPAEDTLTVAYGIIGAYPNAFYRVTERELPLFIDTLARLKTEADYRALMDHFGVRRTSADFWKHSDLLHRLYHQQAGIEAGLLDYNRLENR